MSKGNITFGKWEMSALLINAITSQVYLGFPRIMAENDGTAAWMGVVYIFIMALISFLIINRLYSRFEGKSLLDVAEFLAGGVGRVITGLVVSIYILLLISVILREFAEDMKIISLQVSPISYVAFFFLAGMVVAAYLGLEAIVRMHAIVVPVIIAGFLIIALGVSPYFDLTNLFPIMGNGSPTIFRNGAVRLSSYSSLIGLFLLFPYIKKNSIFRASGLIAIISSSAIMLTAVLSYTLVFPYPTSGDNLLPVYHLARLINYGQFFQRIEAIFVFLWAASALLYLSYAFFLSILSFKNAFRLKYYRPLILPFAVLTFSISILPPNLMAALELENTYLRTYALLTSFGLTFLILIAASIKRKGMRKEERKK